MTASIATDPLSAATAVVAIVDPQLRRNVAEALARTSIQLVDDLWNSGDIDELIVAVERLRPSVLFLGLPGLGGDGTAIVGRLVNLEYMPRIVAVSNSAHPEVILKTMRAGAAEFLYPPFDSFESVLRSVVTAPRCQPEASATGKTIAFCSVKGGCGATTLACHAANWLRTSGKKEVLLADLNLSTGIAGTLMQTDTRYTLDDALQNLHRLDLKLWKALVAASPAGVDVMPAPAEPQNVVSISRKLPPMVRFWRTQYDFTVIDLGSGITPALLDVVNSIDTLVLVATTEVPALRQARYMIQNLAGRGFGANRVKLVINRMPKRPPIELPELEKIMGLPIHAVIPNDYKILNEAYSHPRLIDQDSDLGRRFGTFTAKLSGINAAEKKTRRLFAFK